MIDHLISLLPKSIKRESVQYKGKDEDYQFRIHWNDDTWLVGYEPTLHQDEWGTHGWLHLQRGDDLHTAIASMVEWHHSYKKLEKMTA